MIASSKCLGIVKEYEEVLAGIKNALPTIYFSEKMNQTVTKDFLTYVFEGILKWSKEDVRDRLSEKIIRQLRLERAINSLDFPPELDPKSDYWYVSCLLYPDSFRYDKDRHTLAVYEKVLSERIPRFPKWFFSDFEGEINASLCLNYALSRYYPYKSIKELYELFASSNANKFLNEIKLLQPCYHYFDSPLDMLHNSLCEEEQDIDCYHRLKMKSALLEAGLSPTLSPIQSYAGERKKYLNMKDQFEICFDEFMDRDDDSEEPVR